MKHNFRHVDVVVHSESMNINEIKTQLDQTQKSLQRQNEGNLRLVRQIIEKLKEIKKIHEDNIKD